MSEEYSDGEQGVIEEKVQEWYEAFSRSGHFEQLSDYEKDESEAVITCFADFMYSYEGQAPEQWNIVGMERCCTGTIPRKMTAEPRYFESVSPVLAAFFRFLGEEDLSPSAGMLARKVEQLGPRIVKNSADSSGWGPAKSFAMAAMASGVDMNSQEAIERFMLQYNQQLLGSRPVSDPSNVLGFPSPPMADYARSQRQRPTKAKRTMQKASRRKNRR